MSERLPYEDSLRDGLNDLPLPGEEQSWQQMKKLLEEDDDERVPPPVFLRSCIGWGFLLLVVLGGLWLIIRPDKWWNKNNSSTAQHNNAPKSNGLQRPDSAHQPNDNTSKNLTRIYTGDSLSVKSSTTQGGIKATPSGNDDPTSVTTSVIRKRSSSKGAIGDNYKRQTAGRSSNHNNAPGIDQSSTTVTGKRASSKNKGAEIASPQPATALPAKPSVPREDSVVTTQKPLPGKPVDTLKKTVKKPTPSDTSTKKDNKPKEKTKAKYYVSTGIGLQQQIPLAGQKITPYNYYGRKGSLADYIPSVYVRLHREEHWFVQGEFRYGAPQAVRRLSYEQYSFFDSGQIRIARLQLQKTFYHQLPLSFNYYVLPHLSVGGGIMYSRFHGAISEQEVSGASASTQRDSILSRKIVTVPSGTDSFFTRSQLHLLFQTEYTWRRLSLSLRYTRGLQPFIRYADPSGQIKEETNESFEALLRFRIWRSKKK